MRGIDVDIERVEQDRAAVLAQLIAGYDIID